MFCPLADFQKYLRIAPIGWLLPSIISESGTLLRLYRSFRWRSNEGETIYDENYRQESFWGIVESFLVSLAVSISDYYHMGWYTIAELVRNILGGISSIISVVSVQSDMNQFGTITAQRHGRTIASKRGVFNSMPELEDVTNVIQNDNMLSKFATSNDKLEPAFVRETDFPSGWMVYHPKLGVVPKVVADELEREQPTDREPESFNDINKLGSAAADYVTTTVSEITPDVTNGKDSFAPNGHVHATRSQTREMQPTTISHGDRDQCSQGDAKSGLPVLRSIMAT